MEYLMDYWQRMRESKNQQGQLYAEGGPLKPDDLEGMCLVYVFSCRRELYSVRTYLNLDVRRQFFCFTALFHCR